MLTRNTFLVKERVGFMKMTDAYDIFDPATGKQVGTAKEKISGLVTSLRIILSKRLLPTCVEVREHESDRLLFSLKRGPAFFRSTVHIVDGSGNRLGHFKSKVFSLGGGFFVFDANDNQVAEVKGDWKGWNFKFLDASKNEIGTVARKWAGVSKELFTSADNYIINIDEQQASPATSVLLLAAGLAIDIVFKEAQ